MELEKFPKDPDDPLPDFMIAGMQKSGTTTLNTILSNHPKIFLKDDEKMFFKLDKFSEHNEYYPYENGDWTWHDFENNFDEYYKWYKSVFEEAESGQVIGEDSPVYMTSEKAAHRIKRVIPDVKLIFLLRDPVDRAYSNYWHKVRNSRAIYDFEGTLRFGSNHLVTRGFYEEHLSTYYELFSRDQIKVIIFEEFIQDIPGIAEDVFQFLGLESIDVSKLDTHQHQSKGPFSMNFQAWLNWIFRELNTNRYYGQVPNLPEPNKNPFAKFLYQQLTWLNMSKTQTPPDMKPETREFLQNLYARENSSLDELIGRDLSQYWEYM